MKKLVKPFTAVLFGVFVVGVAAAVLFYSFNGLGLIFPNDLLGQIFGLMLFDLAAFVWFMVFITACLSTMQYVFAMIGFLVGLGGTLGLVGIEVGLSSGMLAEGTMQKPLTYIFVGVMIGHLILIYAHKAAHPVTAADISLGVEKAKITDQAEKEATKILTDNIQHLSAPIAQELVKQVMDGLNLRPTSRTVLDLPALTVDHVADETDSTAQVKPLDYLKAWWSKTPAQPRTYEQKVPASVNIGQPVFVPDAPAPEPDKMPDWVADVLRDEEQRIKLVVEAERQKASTEPAQEKPAGEDASFQPGKETQ